MSDDSNSLRAVRIRAWQKERETNAHGMAEYADAKIAELQREVVRSDFLQRMQQPPEDKP